MDSRLKKEKPKQAIALSYDPAEDAPKVIASGRGLLAERIIEKANEYDVPVHRDDKLADTLSRSIGGGSALPVGAITSLLGAPFFIAIIFSRKENHKC